MTDQEARTSHRLEGLEPDNLLAFLALLGLLRTIDYADATLRPRISWARNESPLRPCVHLFTPVTAQFLVDRVADGIEKLATYQDFNGQKDLNYKQDDSRRLLVQAANDSASIRRARADLFAALMSDSAVKDGKEQIIDPTPLCLLFGQGHQHFLERLADVPRLQAPFQRGRGKQKEKISTQQCIFEALFFPWHREDPTKSFRWDPQEDVRYATMAGDPTDAAYKSGTQDGANRLAAIGLAALTLAPETRAGRVRPSIIGGAYDSDGFSFTWPIWHEPTTLAGIVALLAHPKLRVPKSLQYLGVEYVMEAKRISVGKFMNFTRARPPTAEKMAGA